MYPATLCACILQGWDSPADTSFILIHLAAITAVERTGRVLVEADNDNALWHRVGEALLARARNGADLSASGDRLHFAAMTQYGAKTTALREAVRGAGDRDLAESRGSKDSFWLAVAALADEVREAGALR